MEHVVFFPSPDGTPAFRRVPALQDAVRLVEHLRNVEGVHEVSVHALGDEVPLAFRTWYRVEVPAPAAAVPAQPVAEPTARPRPEVPVEARVEDVADEPVAVAQDDEPVVETPRVDEPVAAGANGHRPDASLGFFAT